TRCSGRPSRLSVGGAAGVAAAGLDVAAGALACCASPLVTRPPRPEPSTEDGSTPFSERILAAAGEAIPAAGAPAAAGVAVAAGAPAAGAAAAWAGAAAALPSESMRAMGSPEVTVL